MWSNTRDILQSILRRIYRSTIARLPTTSADERTRASWAKSIESYQAVPDAYKDFFEPLMKEGRAFPYTVLTPSYEGFMHRTTEKLVCDLMNEIYVLERRENKHEAQCYLLEGISYVEVRTVLLDSRIIITGVTKEGEPASSTLRFNSVTDYLLTPIVERIRLAAVDSNDATLALEREKFDHWVKVNYKFMSYAKRSLLGGEKVIQAILQPEIRLSAFTVLGRIFYRTISPTKVIILTDGELIVIQEEERHGAKDKYGGIWDFIPLNKIRELSASERGNDLLVLSIEMPKCIHLDYLFQLSAQEQINQLLHQFDELIRDL